MAGSHNDYSEPPQQFSEPQPGTQSYSEVAEGSRASFAMQYDAQRNIVWPQNTWGVASATKKCSELVQPLIKCGEPATSNVTAAPCPYSRACLDIKMFPPTMMYIFYYKKRRGGDRHLSRSSTNYAKEAAGGDRNFPSMKYKRCVVSCDMRHKCTAPCWIPLSSASALPFCKGG